MTVVLERRCHRNMRKMIDEKYYTQAKDLNLISQQVVEVEEGWLFDFFSS